jgi:hypothetical protein
MARRIRLFNAPQRESALMPKALSWSRKVKTSDGAKMGTKQIAHATTAAATTTKS